MVICPVCEHAQDGGGECQVCGKRFEHPGADEPRIARLPDLEPTVLEPRAAANVDPVPDLEPTSHQAGSAGGAPVEVASWIERTSLPAEGASTPDLLAAAVCRYCRTPASPGDVFCGGCGLKLPFHARATALADPPLRRCRFCGVSGAGDACPSCGALFPREG